MAVSYGDQHVEQSRRGTFVDHLPRGFAVELVNAVVGEPLHDFVGIRFDTSSHRQYDCLIPFDTLTQGRYAVS